MKPCILAPVRLIRAEGERSLGYEYDDQGYNISFPWRSLPYGYRRELMYGVTDELLRASRKIYEDDPAQIRPRRLAR